MTSAEKRAREGRHFFPSQPRRDCQLLQSANNQLGAPSKERPATWAPQRAWLLVGTGRHGARKMMPWIFMVVVCAIASESSRCSGGTDTILETAENTNTSVAKDVVLMCYETDVRISQEEQDSVLTSRTDALDVGVLLHYHRSCM